MAQNKVQFQKGVSLTQFLELYGTEDQCFIAPYIGLLRQQGRLPALPLALLLATKKMLVYGQG